MYKVLFVLLLLLQLLYAQKSFVIYVNQHINNNNAIKKWQPTVDYLNRKLPQYSFTLLPIKPTQVDTIKKLLNEHKIDFLITQPAIYTELKYTHNINALLTMSNRYQMSQFGSVIISHKSSNIKSMEDIKNKRLIAIAPFGFGGWLIGYNELVKHGIDPLKDKSVEFVGSQKKVIEEILDQKADVGIVRTGMIEKLSKEMNLDNLFIINKQKCKKRIKLSTQLFPEWAFAVASHVDLTVANDLFDALVELDENSYAAKMGEYTNWHLAKNYNEVEKMFERLRLGHYKDLPNYRLQDIVLSFLMGIILFVVAIIYSRFKMTQELKNKLVQEVALKTQELERVNIELATIFNLNPHITVITDGVRIQRVNQRFLDFFAIKHLEEFTQEYACICDRFEKQEGYLQAQVGRQTWIEYVDAHPNLFHKALIIQNNQEYIFSIHVASIHYLDQSSYIASLEDISTIDKIATTDKLTTLYNRVKLDEILSKLMQKFEAQHPFSVALIDIDFFKKVNDKYGHIIGDKVLVDLAKILQNHSHNDNTVGRWGGEEFMIIFEETHAQDAYRVMERIRNVVEKHNFITLEPQTISIGIAQCICNKGSIETLIDQADQALYKAKESGRNQTLIYQPIV
jgi:diguanylate cyclase (GGDEF)-like protein